MIPRSLLAVVASGLFGLAAAQTKSTCNPLKKDNCPVDPALSTSLSWNLTKQPDASLWDEQVGFINFDEEKGATFSINKQGDSPTLRSQFYFFFGRTEVHLKAAPGIGIVSSMMWLSDDLDEVDWEMLGANSSTAASNYFGKGIDAFDNGGYHLVDGGTTDDYHNYTTVWTKEKLEWWIDGKMVRTLTPAEANNTQTYPQTPMRISLGIWAGGDPTMPKGTQEWAGGVTDYKKGPYNMYVKKVAVHDYSSGKEYTYGDKSGKWESIKVTQGTAAAVTNAKEAAAKATHESTSQKWDKLPSTTKTGIYVAAAGAAAIGVGALIFYFWRQRRSGFAEARSAEKAASERADLMAWRTDEPGAEGGYEYNSGKYQRI